MFFGIRSEKEEASELEISVKADEVVVVVGGGGSVVVGVCIVEIDIVEVDAGVREFELRKEF